MLSEYESSICWSYPCLIPSHGPLLSWLLFVSQKFSKIKIQGLWAKTFLWPLQFRLKYSIWEEHMTLEGTTDSMDMSLSKLWETVKGREAWGAAAHRVAKSQTQLSTWTTATAWHSQSPCSFMTQVSQALPMGFPGGSDHKESACIVGDSGWIPGLGRSPGKGNGYPLQYSFLENSMDSGTWWAIVHGVAKSQTQLSN